MDETNQSGSTIRGDLGHAGADFARAATLAQRSIARALFGGPVVAGCVAGRYRIGERLGAGAQGAVWRAFDERLGRDVAIKVSHLARTSGLALAQNWMRHEARMLGRISHPNVVGVFDVGINSASAFGADDDGAVIYVVLELVRGRTLAEWLREKARTTAEIDAVFVAIAAGLQAAHDSGLVHCDVKPGNIFVTDEGVAKLGDFGLAHARRRLAEAAAATLESSQLTTSVAALDASQPSDTAMTGPQGGTPVYMPPEQFHCARVDARADQYALAGTWFEAVFGALPHGRGTPMALLEAKLAGPPARPTHAMSLSRFGALARALAPDPSDRYASVVELARAVTRRRLRRFVALGLAAVGVVMAVSLGAMTPTRPGCRERADDEASRFDVANDLSAHDEHLAYRVKARWDQQIRAQTDVRRSICAVDSGSAAPNPAMLACLDRIERLTAGSIAGIEPRSRRSFERAFSVLERLPDPRGCLTATVKDEPDGTADVDDLDAEIRRVSGATLLATRHIEAGEPSAALAVLGDLDRTSPAGLVFANEIDLVQAHALLGVRQIDQATAAYQAVWDRAVAGSAPLDAARAAGGLAHIVGYERHEHDAGLAWIRHGKSQLARFGDAPLVEAEMLGVEGTLLGAIGDNAGGLAAIERALVLLAPEGREAATISLEENAAVLEVSLGRNDAADARLRHVLAWRESKLGPMHLSVARTLFNLAFVEHRREDLDTAEALLGRALEIHDAMPEPNQLERARILSGLAGVAVSRGDLGAAVEMLTRADEIRVRVLGAGHPELAASVLMRLDLLVQAGDVEAADALAHASRDGLAQAIDPASEEAINLEHMLARIDGLAGRVERGVTRMTAIIELAAPRTSRQHELARWSLETAAMARAAGDLDGAHLWAQRAEQYHARHGGDDEVPRDLEREHAATAATRAEIAAL